MNKSNIPSKAIKSLSRTFMLKIVGFISIVLIAISLITGKLYIDNAKKQLQINTQQFAHLIASMSINDLKNNSHDSLHEKLVHLKTLSTINYLHIYKVGTSEKDITFFTSYNNNNYNFPPIPNKIDEIDTLSTPKVSRQTIELILPIKKNENLYGYVYVQANTEYITSLNNKILTTLIILIGLMILCSLLVVHKLHQRIVDPINSLVEKIKKISQYKDYTIKLDIMQYKEFDILARNINIMLSRTDKHIFNLIESKDQSKMLTAELENKVNKRTSALKESNQELLSTLEKLHQFQGQLVESKKMASLGDMVAGVAHEVNTPIGLGVTASTLLADRLNEINQAFEDKTLKSSQLKKFLNEGQENIDIIYRNLTRAANLISSFKKVAVDQSNDNISTFNINDLLQDVLLTLAPELDKKPYKIEINCPVDLMITTKPGSINQICINLILNSILHGFEGRDYGTININIMRLGDQLNFNFRDDGIGIHESIKDKVFDPFTTTKRGSGGSGLGLHLVYNLVTQALGGNIKLESDERTGAIFDIYFPID